LVVRSVVVNETYVYCVQQLSNLWDDYNVKVNDDLVGHITSYASRFPEAKVCKSVTMLVM